MAERWRERAKRIRGDAQALAIAARDERMPLLSKLLIAGLVLYLLSPIDLVPDVIPVIGLVDELILMPIGIALAVRLTPPAVLDDARRRVAAGERISTRAGAALVLGLWLAMLLACWLLLRRML